MARPFLTRRDFRQLAGYILNAVIKNTQGVGTVRGGEYRIQYESSCSPLGPDQGATVRMTLRTAKQASHQA